jgi:hypothetical protein
LVKGLLFDVWYTSSGDEDMPTLAQMTLAALLVVIAAFCVYQGLAAGGLPENRWAHWLIDGIIGLTSLSGAGWLIGQGRSNAQRANR